MKTLFSTVIFLVGLTLAATAQTGTVSLDEIDSKLLKGELTTSSVLTDKKYLSLHPETPFRELIKKHSNASILTITTLDEPGKRIKVVATVKNESGLPVPGALVYLYQTDARGWYAADAPHVLQFEGDIRHARLFGYVKTDKEGKFELHSIKPSGYPKSDLPAHIHVHVIAEGYSSLGTEFLFDDDERLVGSIREQSVESRFPIAKPEKADPPCVQQFSYLLLVRK